MFTVEWNDIIECLFSNKYSTYSSEPDSLQMSMSCYAINHDKHCLARYVGVFKIQLLTSDRCLVLVVSLRPQVTHTT